MDSALRAVFDAVHTQVAFCDPKRRVGITSSVTVAEAFFAIGAEFYVAPYPEKRPERKEPQKSAQWTDRTAPKARQKPVRKYHRKEYKPQQSSAVKKGLLQVEPTLAVIDCRKDRDREGPSDEWNRIEQSNLE